MANVRGQSTKQNQIVGVLYNNGYVKDDNGKVIGAMVDFIRPDKDDPNPHLVTRVSDEVNPKTGKPYMSNGKFYTTAQLNAVFEAAGTNGITEPTQNGGERHVFAVKGDLVPTKGGLAVNTKTLGPADFAVTKETLPQIYADMAAVREANELRAQAEKAAQAQAQSGLSGPAWEQPQAPAPQWEQPSTAADRHLDMDQPAQDQGQDYDYDGPGF